MSLAISHTQPKLQLFHTWEIFVIHMSLNVSPPVHIFEGKGRTRLMKPRWLEKMWIILLIQYRIIAVVFEHPKHFS